MIIGRVKERDKWNMIDYPFLGISERGEIVLFLNREGSGVCLLEGEKDSWTVGKILLWDIQKFKSFNGKIEIENKER